MADRDYRTELQEANRFGEQLARELREAQEKIQTLTQQNAALDRQLSIVLFERDNWKDTAQGRVHSP